MSTTPPSPKALYQSIDGKNAEPLEPDDLRYVPRMQAVPEKDPILQLAQRIVFSASESVHLLTGFRGNGKSTELRRLKKELEASDCLVFLLEMKHYVFETKPIDISDFTLSLMLALNEAVEQAFDGALQPLSQNFTKRLWNFLTTEVQLDSVVLQAGLPNFKTDLKWSLKRDSNFKEELQDRLKKHINSLIRQARVFVTETVDAIRNHTDNAHKKVVVLVDDLEKLRGESLSDEQVYSSVQELFLKQAENLAYPKLHLLYTVPPYLTLQAANPGLVFNSTVVSWPNIHIRTHDNNEDPDGYAIMEQILSKRYPDWASLIAPDLLKQCIKYSGGDIRDFFRLIKQLCPKLDIVRRNTPQATATQEQIDQVIVELRVAYRIIFKNEIRLLAKIHQSKDIEQENQESFAALVRFFDSNHIMNYQNGTSWYDIHPLCLDDIQDSVLP